MHKHSWWHAYMQEEHLLFSCPLTATFLSRWNPESIQNKAQIHKKKVKIYVGCSWPCKLHVCELWHGLRCVRGWKPLTDEQSAQRGKLGLGFSNIPYIQCLNQIKANIPYYPASSLQKGELLLGDILVPLIGFGFQSVRTLLLLRRAVCTLLSQAHPIHSSFSSKTSTKSTPTQAAMLILDVLFFCCSIFWPLDLSAVSSLSHTANCPGQALCFCCPIDVNMSLTGSLSA